MFTAPPFGNAFGNEKPNNGSSEDNWGLTDSEMDAADSSSGSGGGGKKKGLRGGAAVPASSLLLVVLAAAMGFYFV